MKGVRLLMLRTRIEARLREVFVSDNVWNRISKHVILKKKKKLSTMIILAALSQIISAR
jgi:hypothetical protein